jgi:hypothetical protein
MRKGSKFRLTSDAEENYKDILKELFGDKWSERVFRVTHVAHSVEEHRGYDEGVAPQGLYDFEDVKSGKEMSVSVYDWEIEEV